MFSATAGVHGPTGDLNTSKKGGLGFDSSTNGLISFYFLPFWGGHVLRLDAHTASTHHPAEDLMGRVLLSLCPTVRHSVWTTGPPHASASSSGSTCHGPLKPTRPHRSREVSFGNREIMRGTFSVGMKHKTRWSTSKLKANIKRNQAKKVR